MKALTLYPPWAYAICHLGKRVENRSWKPPRQMIGQRIAIHAGAPMSLARLQDEIDGVIYMADCAGVDDVVTAIDDLTASTCSAIVATAVIAGIASPTDSPTRPWHTVNQYGWLLADVRVLARPVPCRGSLGLWTVPHEVASTIFAASAAMEADR